MQNCVYFIRAIFLSISFYIVLSIPEKNCTGTSKKKQVDYTYDADFFWDDAFLEIIRNWKYKQLQSSQTRVEMILTSPSTITRLYGYAPIDGPYEKTLFLHAEGFYRKRTYQHTAEKNFRRSKNITCIAIAKVRRGYYIVYKINSWSFYKNRCERSLNAKMPYYRESTMITTTPLDDAEELNKQYSDTLPTTTHYDLQYYDDVWLQLIDVWPAINSDQLDFPNSQKNDSHLHSDAAFLDISQNHNDIIDTSKYDLSVDIESENFIASPEIWEKLSFIWPVQAFIADSNVLEESIGKPGSRVSWQNNLCSRTSFDHMSTDQLKLTDQTSQRQYPISNPRFSNHQTPSDLVQNVQQMQFDEKIQYTHLYPPIISSVIPRSELSYSQNSPLRNPYIFIEHMISTEHDALNHHNLQTLPQFVNPSPSQMHAGVASEFPEHTKYGGSLDEMIYYTPASCFTVRNHSDHLAQSESVGSLQSACNVDQALSSQWYYQQHIAPQATAQQYIAPQTNAQYQDSALSKDQRIPHGSEEEVKRDEIIENVARAILNLRM